LSRVGSLRIKADCRRLSKPLNYLSFIRTRIGETV
jgi:hypothetical protein